MVTALNKIYKKQLFAPTIPGIFINPFFFIRRGLYKAVKKFAPEIHGGVLDLGCGSKPYKPLFTNATQYIGVDIDNPGHDHKNEDVDMFYDGKTIPFENGHFDGVFFSEVLEHIFEPDAILDEIHRVLKDGGKFLLTVPFSWDEHEIPNDFGRYSSYGIQYLLEKHHFRIVHAEKTGHFFEVIVQYVTHYIRHLLFTKYKYGNIATNVIFIAPFSICGGIIAWLLPRKNSLYFNNVILAEKVASK